MRFSLGKMFLAVAMLALVCAGMMYRTFWWTSGIVTFTWMLFVLGIIAAIVTNGRVRAKWVGFVIAGTVYMTVISFPIFEGKWLITNLPLAAIAKYAQIDFRENAVAGSLEYWPYTAGIGSYNSTKQLTHFFLIGHCVFSWLFAVLAAWFAGRMYDRRERGAKETK